MRRPDRKLTLEALGSGKLRRMPGRSIAEQEVDIMLGLLEMKKAELIRAIHSDRSRIEIELPEAPGQKRPLTWNGARQIVEKFRHERAAAAAKLPEPPEITMRRRRA